MKVRNYSFKDSTRLPEHKMTEINGVKIPAMPGSCYHAIICALAENKDQFVVWPRILERVEKYMRQFGGDEVWNKFKNKSQVKPLNRRIKDNVHTLTRRGKDCYGYRMHEKGMCIYFFKDGAMLLTGGEIETHGKTYDVTFPCGRKLQVRYRGTTMTSREYKRFYDAGYIDINCKILDNEGIKQSRVKARTFLPQQAPNSLERVQISIELDESYDQNTADRLSNLGLVVQELNDNMLIGIIIADKVNDVKEDTDVISVTVLGQESYNAG
jgi:hypothetical protein